MSESATAHPLNAEDDISARLEPLSASERVEWALAHLPGDHILSSSFGVQSALMLHLVTQHRPDIPVVLIDTGYLFPETYQFIDTLRERLSLNLHIARPKLSPSWIETRYGKLWEQGEEGLTRYNTLAKVEPMRRSLDELNVGTWFSGLRRVQAKSRADTAFAEISNGRWKVHPIADWSNRDVGLYLKKHHLPYHPLWDEGYVSIGDTHTTRRLEPGMSEEDTRFFGLKRECGLHTDI